MKIIADSSSTRTEWVLVDGHKIVEHAFTEGLNPYFQSRREISHTIRLQLPEQFFRRRWEHVYFYGAGCANESRNKIMESSLVAQFRSPVTVKSDLLGAARGLLVRERGMACILGTGSNSCLYNGHDITENVKSLGFILGDEGSGAYLGKQLVSDCIKGLAPEHVIHRFYEHFATGPDRIMDAVYIDPLPNRALSRYSFFLQEMLDDAYVYQLVYSSFMSFFMRNVARYDYRDIPICFVGSVACVYSDILRRAASTIGIEISKIERSSVPGLVKYHADGDE